MSLRLHGKTAFVTAAGQGIGRAVALAFAREGARVIATDRDAVLLQALQQAADAEAHASAVDSSVGWSGGTSGSASGSAGGSAAPAAWFSTRVLDVTDAAAIRSAATAVGAVDVLFNAAGVVHAGSVLDCTEDEWSFAFDLNVRSQFRTIQAFLPGMLKRPDGSSAGSIINVASVVGSLKGAPNRFVYGCTKGAVIGLTKAVAADFVTHGIRCNAICPGTVDSPSLHERIAAQAAASGQSTAQVQAAFVARQPLGRLGSAQEIAALAVYLASDESAFTTGTAHVIDGGWSN